MNQVYIFLASLAFLCGAYSKECPTIKTISAFNASRYLGKWYEIEKYPQAFELDTKCVTATYGLNPNGTVDVFNQAILSTLNTSIEIRGYAVPNPTNPANLTVHFPLVPFPGKYWVIDTDYDTYSLVYSCDFTLFNIEIESAWILARQPELPETTINKLSAQLSAVKSDISKFHKTSQTGCPKGTFETDF